MVHYEQRLGAGVGSRARQTRPKATREAIDAAKNPLKKGGRARFVEEMYAETAAMLRPVAEDEDLHAVAVGLLFE